MAMIKCSECGRAISDKAVACIGCGAPVLDSPDVALMPKRVKSVKLSGKQIKVRALLFLSMFVVGVFWAGVAEHSHSGNRLPVLIATLLIIGGITGLLVALVHAVTSRG